MSSARSRVAAALCLLLAATVRAAAEALTMEEAIARALAQNRELATAALQLGASDLGVADAWSEFAWTVSPDGSLTRGEDGTTARLGFTAGRRTTAGTEFDGGASLTDNGSNAGDRRVGELRIGLRQPLLRGRGREINLDGILSAQASRQSARRSFETRRAALVLAVVQAHQDLARLQAQLAYDEQSLKRNGQLKKLTETRERQGRASRVDSLRVDYQYGQAEASLADTGERLVAQRQDLCELLGAPIDLPFEAVSGPPLAIDEVAAPLAEALALSNRLDYAEALQAVGEARRGIRVSRQRILPDLDLVAGYELQGRGDTTSDALGLDEERWNVGLAGDTDLHRRAERSQLRRSMIDAAAAEEALAALEVRIRREAHQAVLAYEWARKQVGFAERNLELAHSRARLARRMFELGRGDNFTATDAEAELLRAQSDALDARTAASVAAYRLKHATGTLLESPDALKPRGAAAVAETAGP